MIIIYAVDYGTLGWFDELNRRTIPLCYIDNINTFSFLCPRNYRLRVGGGGILIYPCPFVRADIDTWFVQLSPPTVLELQL